MSTNENFVDNPVEKLDHIALDADLSNAFITLLHILAKENLDSISTLSNYSKNSYYISYQEWIDQFLLNLKNFYKLNELEYRMIVNLPNVSSDSIIDSIKTTLREKNLILTFETKEDVIVLEKLRSILTAVITNALLSTLTPTEIVNNSEKSVEIRYDGRLRSLLRNLIKVFMKSYNEDIVSSVSSSYDDVNSNDKSIDSVQLNASSATSSSEALLQKTAPSSQNKNFFFNNRKSLKKKTLTETEKLNLEKLRSSAKFRSFILQESEDIISTKLWQDYNLVDLNKPHSITDPETAEQMEKKNKSDKMKKWAAIGFASLGGAAIVGLTGGLAAPLIGAGLGSVFTTVGVGGTIAAGVATLTTSAGVALFGTFFGLAGGGLSAYKLNRRLKDLEEFSFFPVVSHHHSLSVIICISGWLNARDDIWEPWTCIPAMAPWAECDALVYDSHLLLELDNAINDFIGASAITAAAKGVLAQTVMAGLVSALTWPIAMLQFGYLVDNPWSIALDRSEKAGVLLAREVIAKNVHGARPVVLIGYSMGARVIWYCCRELAKFGVFGSVESIYLIGAPVLYQKSNLREDQIGLQGWKDLRKVCSGRIVNAYSINDWLLGFLLRSISMGLVVAGLGPVQTGVFEEELLIENVDLSDIVNGHTKYKDCLPDILERIGFERDEVVIQTKKDSSSEKNVSQSVKINKSSNSDEVLFETKEF
ncbi:Transmembrane and coiled-coil domain-containing protein 4 [Lobulomyces angularis]|nr:Transmembrane and coiled-coil domain-containing protein 4 [Lobulomyces angularis]